MITEKELKDRLSFNLIRYRRSNNITQLELAEKLNYSDKSVSKWERKEALPDLLVLTQIAEIYGIGLSDLLSDRKRLARPKHRLNKLLISMIAFTAVWFVATSFFVLLGIFAPDLKKIWLSFIYAIPVSLFVLMVISKMWGYRFLQLANFSLMSWSIPLSIVLSLNELRLWLLFIAIIPLQILVLLWYFLWRQKLKIKNL